MLWKWFDRLDIVEGIRKSRQLGPKGGLEKKMANFICCFGKNKVISLIDIQYTVKRVGCVYFTSNKKSTI